MVPELYKKVGQQMGVNPDTVFSSGQCENMSDELVIALRHKGTEADVMAYHGGWTVTFHDFVIFVEDGEEWIADPTWQQFLIEPNTELPHVLITKKSETVDTLTKLGIPKDKHAIWLDARRMGL